MTQTIEHWRPSTGQYEVGPPGLMVLTDDDDFPLYHRQEFPEGFRDAVDAALTYIQATPSGARVLARLEAAPYSVTISPSVIGGNNISLDDAVAPLSLVAKEIVFDGKPGAATRTALAQVFGGVAAEAGLAQLIGQTPRFTLTSPPGSGTGLKATLQSVREYLNRWALLVDPRYFRWSDTNEGYFEQQVWLGGPWGTGSGVRISGNAIDKWMNHGTLPKRLTAQDREHVELATIVALYSHSPKGSGCGADIRWDISDSKMNQKRPPAIGLAHELIHAYYGVKGKQPGGENNHASVALFEYLCVGLGPWDEATPSENSIRKEWWPNTAHLIPSTDTLNRKVPPKRITYN